jgi:dTDP-4-dehydrorhamnose 3,5-epimerase-like enzyme
MNSRWSGLRAEAQHALSQRSYQAAPLPDRLASTGVEAAELVAASAEGSGVLEGAWIPGVEVFPRRIYPQRHRGSFGEFARQGEGVPGKIGFWPKQWAAARMFAGTSKGFHIHPPHIPAGTAPAEWFAQLYVQNPTAYALRPYDLEQWDLMFFVQGTVEMFLVDEREGLPRRRMRFWIEGDDQRGPGNVGVVIPAGVAHALRADPSRDALMVYGTSTVFDPGAEGRIADGVERQEPPEGWGDYFNA